MSYFDGRYDFDKDYVNIKLTEIKKLISVNFNIQDLKSAISLWVEDGGILSFAHRSIQEYFAVLHIKSLSTPSKEKVYTKVQNKLSSKQSHDEINNFLFLCEEMDKVGLSEFLSLVILKKIRVEIESNSIQKKIRSVILFNCRSHLLSIEPSHIDILAISNASDYHRYKFFLKNTSPIFLAKFETIISSECIKTFIIEKKYIRILSIQRKSEPYKRADLNYESVLGDNFIEKLLENTNIEEIVDEFITGLDNLIKETEQFIAQHKKAEEDLIDLV